MSKKSALSFPFIFELLVWLFYVAFYKYSYYLEQAGLPHVPDNDFPYLQICLYSICSTLYLIPYYRWAAPHLLRLKKYGWLTLLTFVYFIFLNAANNMVVAWLFKIATMGTPVHHFFEIMNNFFIDWNLIMTDTLAFLCLAFARFSYQNELQRHKIETDHLHLQLSMLKTQLQPHFLFNTLNSLYGMSLTGSKDTSRYILLLSQMMQYILYDCDQEEVELKEELNFLEGYFELEQKKFPNASIILKVPDHIPLLKIPPLLFLPLVENSFKHGRHKLENEAGVYAELILTDKKLIFNIENEILPSGPFQIKNKHSGIGLKNIKKRLELYYPMQNQLLITEAEHKYHVNLSIDL